MVIILTQVPAGLAAQPSQAKLLSITGRIRPSDCKGHRCRFVRLVEARPEYGKHRSKITAIGRDLSFTIKAKSSDLPPGRYEVETGTVMGSIGATGEIVDIGTQDKDLGLICFNESCSDL